MKALRKCHVVVSGFEEMEARLDGRVQDGRTTKEWVMGGRRSVGAGTGGTTEHAPP